MRRLIMKRIFVTSLGVISCLGDSVEQFWEGICTPEGYKTDGIKMPKELPQNIDRRIARRMDRFSYMTLSVSMRAMDNHHTLRDGFNEMRTGTVFNSAYGPLNSNLSFCRELEADGVDAVSPIL